MRGASRPLPGHPLPSSVRGDRNEGWPLRLKQVKRRVRVIQRLDRRVGRRTGRVRPRPQCGGARRHQGPGEAIQAVVEQPGQCRVLLVLAVNGAGPFACIGAEQIVHAVAARSDGMDEVRPGQRVQHAVRLLGRVSNESGQAVGIEVGARMQPDQPERAG